MISRAADIVNGWFMPKNLGSKIPGLSHDALIYKTRVLVPLLLLVSLFGTFLTTYHALLTSHESDPLNIVGLCASLVLMLLPFYLKWSGNYDRTALMFVWLGLIAIPTRIVSTGAVSSPILPWLALVPVCAIYFVGIRLFVVASIVMLVQLICISYWGATDSFPFPIVGLDLHPVIKFVGPYSAFLTVTYFVWLSESERVRWERASEESRAQIIHSARLASLGEMAGSIAHEVNNPLAIVRLLADQLEENALTDRSDKALTRRLCGKLNSTVDRIANIINGLRALSRDGTHDPRKNEDLVQIILTTLDFCLERFKKKGIELFVDKPDGALVVPCRSTQISQVLLNLLNNAYDAVAGLPEKWVRISIADRGEYVELRVLDNGPKIPPEVQAKLFTPFFTTKEVGKGTGLGLGISRGIIDSHQGALELDPDTPATCFVIRLPKDVA